MTSFDPDREAPTVVVVDADGWIRRSLRQALADAGIPVIGEASDGSSGVRLVGETRPDVVLLDLRLPDISGIEAARRVRADGGHTRVVLLTGSDDPGRTWSAREVGADDSVVKDGPSGDIVDAVLRAWKDSGAAAEPEATGPGPGTWHWSDAPAIWSEADVPPPVWFEGIGLTDPFLSQPPEAPAEALVGPSQPIAPDLSGSSPRRRRRRIFHLAFGSFLLLAGTAALLAVIFGPNPGGAGSFAARLIVALVLGGLGARYLLVERGQARARIRPPEG